MSLSDPGQGRRRALDAVDVLLAAAALGAAVVFVGVAGWLVDLVRFATAQLPASTAAGLLDDRQLLGDGFSAILLMLGVFAVGCGLAYFSSARRWDVHGQDWHDLIRKHGVQRAAQDADPAERQLREQRHTRRRVARADRIVEWTNRHQRLSLLATPAQHVAQREGAKLTEETVTEPKPLQSAPLGDWAVRLIAGFNIGILAALIAVTVARAVQAALPAGEGWVGAVAGVLGFLITRWVLTRTSPLLIDARAHAVVWAAVAVLALFASTSVGVLGLTGVLLCTAGRAIGRLQQPRSFGGLVRSPLVWVLLLICVLLAISFEAAGPVAFPTATVTTPSGTTVGGYLARTSDGFDLVTCTALANATSADTRLTTVPNTASEQVRIAGNDYVDSGSRPSLAALAFDALGVKGRPPTLFDLALRPRQPTCAGTLPARLSAGHYDTALGSGVITGPAPADGRARDGEAPIQQTTPPAIAQLAKRYQPTLLVTVADRNWPVSVGAVLAELGPAGRPACLVQHREPETVCPATLASLSGRGAQASDYLQMPVTLGSDQSPDGQFDAFLRGQYNDVASQDAWLQDPGRLDPWATAQIYFYYAGPIRSSSYPKQARNPSVPSGLIALEYWFYYPFNYYPLVVNSSLMNGAPLAGDELNVDLHQGDWEHVDVLLDPKTMQPAWLYMARHSYEGQFVPWNSPSLSFDGSHVVLQAAYGGHPTYLPGCGGQPRVAADDFLSDWLVCGSGRFAFRGGSTPLVDLARTSWACWPGYFGEAKTGVEVEAAGQSENEIDAIKQQVFVAGPRSPLRQAENTGVCAHSPQVAELGR